MSYSLSTLIVFAVALLVVAVSFVCGVLLWWKRKEVPDRSRTILAIPLLLAIVIFGNRMLLTALSPETNMTKEVLSPLVIFTAPLPQLLLLAYPIEVMRPRWMKWRRMLPLLLPWVVICVPGLIGINSGIFTPLYTTADFEAHLWEPNVLWRLLVIPLLLFNALTLIYLPYRWRESSASRGWVHGYIAAFCLIGVFLLVWILTQRVVFQLLHNLSTLVLAVVFTWYELVERIYPPQTDQAVESDTSSNETAYADELWPRIVKLIHEDDLWRDPDLGLDMLCMMVGSNKDYVLRSFRQNADTTFLDYVNSLRIGYVTDELRRNPLQNQRDLFFKAGFRSKTTAYRNFCKYNGQSPTDFIASLGEVT